MALRKAAECVLGKTWFCGSLPAPGATGSATGPVGRGVGVAVARGLDGVSVGCWAVPVVPTCVGEDDGDEPALHPASSAAAITAAASGARRATLMLLPPRLPRRFECSRDYCRPRLCRRVAENVGGAGQYGSMEEESPLTGAEALEGFSAATRAWFEGAFAEPTRAQSGAWQAIGKGEDTLVVAPTGSGKTLAAFLWAIDRLAALPPPQDPKLRCRVLYVSPLKALAVDIERNLRAPLTGIRQAAHRLGLAEPDIRVAVRTGDTAAEDRRKLVSKPPDILITTPESLFLLLTSQARDTLRGVETIIVDEVHAVAGNKRGAHLALSLERLDSLRGTSDQGARPAQRVGLSATVRPVEEVAAFLGGSRAVTVVQPPSPKRIELQVVVPVEDMTDLDAGPGSGPAGGGGGSEDGQAPSRSIWPHVEARVLDLIEQHKSTIVFADSR